MKTMNHIKENNLDKLKEEFENKWKRIWKNHASSLDGRMIWNVNDEDDPDDGWVFAEEDVWSFIEHSLLTQRREIIKKIEGMKKEFFWCDDGFDSDVPYKKHLHVIENECNKFKQDIINQIK